MSDVRIGTSGFSYDDWKGHFYPEDIRKEEMLSYYADRFQTLEVNSTYYAIPGQRTFASMSERTPAGFDFVVKAFKDLTHAEEHDSGVCRRFTRSLDPLAADGKLGCMLAQFPWSFRNNDKNVERLARLKEECTDIPIVVEFRNQSWVCDETFELLRKLGLGFCCVDEPHLKGLMPGVTAATSPISYVRFHGRNYREWWKHDEAWQRYNYLYSEDELSEWVPKVQHLAGSTEKTYVFFNNHYKGQSAKNAVMFAGLLGVEPGGAPQ